MLVIGSQEGKVQFDDLLPFLFVPGDTDAAGSSNTDGFQILGAHDAANAAGGMGIGVHHHGHGNQVLACLTNGSHRGLRSHLLVDFDGGPPYTLPPEMSGILDFSFPSTIREPHRTVGLAFDDDGVIPGILEFRRKVAAHVTAGNQRFWPTGGPQSGYGGPSITRGSCSGQRADSKDDLVGRIKGFGSRRDLVPDHLVSYSGPPQIVLVFLYGIFS